MYALVTGKNQGLASELVSQLSLKGYAVNLVHPEYLADFKYDGVDYDVIINNWGINHLSWIGETEDKDEEILYENIWKPYKLINNLVKNGNVPAKVINVSSITHRVAQRTSSLYCASKAAMVQMTRVMARELAPKGWQVNAYCPGKILSTEMTKLTDQQVLELRGWSNMEANKYALSLIPVGRFMTVKEAAENCLNILNFSHYVNGAIIEATGGV